MKTGKYQIRYNHKETEFAASCETAIAYVKSEAGQNRMYYADAPDGLYCHLSREDKFRDDTGARAYAVICNPSQQN